MLLQNSQSFIRQWCRVLVTTLQSLCSLHARSSRHTAQQMRPHGAEGRDSLEVCHTQSSVLCSSGGLSAAENPGSSPPHGLRCSSTRRVSRWSRSSRPAYAHRASTCTCAQPQSPQSRRAGLSAPPNLHHAGQALLHLRAAGVTEIHHAGELAPGRQPYKSGPGMPNPYATPRTAQVVLTGQ